jgi:hypothetical protein
MCTLSFLPAEGGFHLLMNRDEQRSRPLAMPPDIRQCDAFRALYPSEHGGGTWIGINERGLTIALINWYSRRQLAATPAFSRGAIIPKLLTAESPRDVEILMRALPIGQLNPFRLVVISARERSIEEFRSDTASLEKVCFAWERHHWFSSGFDEPEAIQRRAKTCANEPDHSGDAPLTRLRHLHRSHEPEMGPFSICMHREDACTVSYTEITATETLATISYHDRSPCEERMPRTYTLPFDIP